MKRLVYFTYINHKIPLQFVYILWQYFTTCKHKGDIARYYFMCNFFPESADSLVYDRTAKHITYVPVIFVFWLHLDVK